MAAVGDDQPLSIRIEDHDEQVTGSETKSRNTCSPSVANASGHTV
jgi:hypothetical protein